MFSGSTKQRGVKRYTARPPPTVAPDTMYGTAQSVMSVAVPTTGVTAAAAVPPRLSAPGAGRGAEARHARIKFAY